MLFVLSFHGTDHMQFDADGILVVVSSPCFLFRLKSHHIDMEFAWWSKLFILSPFFVCGICVRSRVCSCTFVFDLVHLVSVEVEDLHEMCTDVVVGSRSEIGI